MKAKVQQDETRTVENATFKAENRVYVEMRNPITWYLSNILKSSVFSWSDWIPQSCLSLRSNNFNRRCLWCWRTLSLRWRRCTAVGMVEAFFLQRSMLRDKRERSSNSSYSLMGNALAEKQKTFRTTYHVSFVPLRIFWNADATSLTQLSRGLPVFHRLGLQ